MIHENEVRRGNKIYMDNIIVTIDKIDQDEYRSFRVYYEGRDKRIHTYPNNAQLNPIPIRPEVLGKCGFKNNGHFWEKDDTFLIRENDDYDSEWGFWYQAPDGLNFVLLKSLHQLQNLYFAIEEKELEVNL